MPARQHDPPHSEDLAWDGDGRHTYASLMHAAGCSLEESGDYIGHSSAYTTDRYRHLPDGQREQAALRLDAFARGVHLRGGGKGCPI